MTLNQSSKKRTRGNILFLILLAVVLFAALSYAVTSSMRGGGNNASNENAKLAAAEILQWFTSVDTAVMRMNLVEGIAYEDISFQYDRPNYNGSTNLGTFTNSRCSSNNCRIFLLEGGGINPRGFSEYATKTPTSGVGVGGAPGYYDFVMIDWPGAGTSLNDVGIMLLYIKPDVCVELNKALSISSTPVSGGSYTPAVPTTNWNNGGYTITTNADQLYTSNTFARTVTGTDAGQYCHVFHVVLKR